MYGNERRRSMNRSLSFDRPRKKRKLSQFTYLEAGSEDKVIKQEL